MDVKATDLCSNCFAEFADHNYVKDSITQYRCPHDRQECMYGFFTGGDPRNFHPDGESCTQDELKNHKAACDLWNEMEAEGKEPTPEECPSGWTQLNGAKVHVLRAPYGIGMQSYFEPQFFEKMDADTQKKIKRDEEEFGPMLDDLWGDDGFDDSIDGEYT